MEYLHKDREQFTESINLAVFKSGLAPEVIEKDYYVTMILKKLSEQFDFIVFKGGTSLSKCHRVISRFSEDIDITIDNTLSQGQKKKLKYGIVDIAAELGLTIPNIDEIRSRRDYNRYELAYESVLDKLIDTVSPSVLMETSFSEISFPTVIMPVHSYIGDLFVEEAPDALDQYGLNVFTMKVQGIDRTLIDKVFAICDYYMKGTVKKHSRHIYDIHRLLPLVKQDDSFKSLVREVRKVRAATNICPSAQPGVDITAMLREIIATDVYKEDYNVLTIKLLEEKVAYEDAIKSVGQIACDKTFDE